MWSNTLLILLSDARMVKLKTANVKSLVEEVIDSLGHPRNEHVTLVVFKEIEGNPKWLGQYQNVCNEHGKLVVNQRIGRCTLDILNAVSIQQVPAEGTNLTQTYSTLRFKWFSP